MLLEKHISEIPNAKVLVLFGGNPLRRDEVVRSLRTISGLTIIGTLSEDEGISTIKQLPQVDIVLIGGRYTQEQRSTIKGFIAVNYPHIKTTEPGVDYPYEETQIKQNIQKLLQ